MTRKEMQRKPISYYLADNDRLSELSVTTIKKWMDETPFDQTIKLLYAKKLKSDNRLSDNMLQLVSTYATDRSNLYDHLHPSEQESIPAAAPEKVKKQVEETRETVSQISEKEAKSKASDGIENEISEVIVDAPEEASTTEPIIRYVDTKKFKKKKKKKKRKAEKEKDKDKDKDKGIIKLKKKKKKSKKDKSDPDAIVTPIEKKKKSGKKSKSKKKKKENKKKVSYVYVRSEGNMGSPFELDDYSGISRYSNWLLSMKEEKKKDKNKAKSKRKKKKSKKKEHSVKVNEMVISESLADLLLKQGHKKKAKRMYKKLSLIFPEKSTYFAAKIETLKK